MNALLVLTCLLTLASCSLRPPIPEGVREPCATDSDCAEGLVCAVEVAGSGVEYEVQDTCQVPCQTYEDCSFQGTECAGCQTDVAAPYCDWYGCK